jgi:hypothetical protein
LVFFKEKLFKTCFKLPSSTFSNKLNFEKKTEIEPRYRRDKVWALLHRCN